MGHFSANLVALATAHGVATEYWDWRGEYAAVPAQTVIAVLGALGVEAPDDGAAAAALAELDTARWRRMLPSCRVRRIDAVSATTCWVHVAHGEPVEVALELEDGTIRTDLRQLDRWVDPAEIDGELIGEATFELPTDLPLGWHLLRASSAGRTAATTVIVVPSRLELPAELSRRQTWGWLTQLYQVRTERSWGFGDFADLGELLAWSGESLGAGFVLINPLHAPAPTLPVEASPYLPITRRFSSPLYLAIEAIAEFAALDGATRKRLRAVGSELSEISGPEELIDRNRVWAAKNEALTLIHAAGRSAAREAEFAAYRAGQGIGLLDFSTWCALAEAHGPDWLEWPQELRNPATSAVALERAGLADRVEYFAWLQWVLDEQHAAAAARAAGMVIGTIHDLAVGVHPTGADSWRLQDCLALGMSVGAPPDEFNQRGQNWSQPPWKPRALAEAGYEPYRDMVRAALRHAGGIRVDHVMGLFRLWWVPPGGSPAEGTYVRYDHEALVGILALEAHRAGAVVIGEDLGTVEPWVREHLHERGMLGTSILWFERDEYGPRHPAQWREMCLGSVTTHDLPPTRGYLAGEHVALRNRLGLLRRPAEEEWSGLRGELAQWRTLLDELGIDRGGEVGDVGSIDAMVRALHEFLAATPCLLRGVALADAAGDRRTHNQPGTHLEYPNWQYPLLDADRTQVLLSDLMDSPRVKALTALFRPAPGRSAGRRRRR